MLATEVKRQAPEHCSNQCPVQPRISSVCYFLTLSLMSGIGAPIGIMGIILPIYTIIDMIETAETSGLTSAVCAMTDHDLASELDAQPAPAQH